MKKIKVLYIFAEPFSYGGQEAFAINMYNQIDKEKYKIDFYTPFKCDNKEIESLLKKNNDNMYFDNYEFFSKSRKMHYIKGVTKIIKNRNYDIVHINSGSTFSLAKGAKIVKKYSNAKVIVHSHATGINNIKHILANIMFVNDFKYVDYFLACSLEAGRFRFLDKIVNSNKFSVINNGIDINKFKYDESIRSTYRRLLKLDKKEFVIGHVGRFSMEKNHIFLINVFNEVKKRYKNVKLLLVGDGDMEDNIIELLTEKKLLDSTIILSKRKDVNKILNAMDIFLFPSLFEGLGIAVIEAQISGLTVLCSDVVPKEAKIINKCTFLKLNRVDEWVQEVVKEINKTNKREFSNLKLLNNDFDSKKCARKLETIYMEVINEK